MRGEAGPGPGPGPGLEPVDFPGPGPGPGEALCSGAAHGAGVPALRRGEGQPMTGGRVWLWIRRVSWR